METPRNPSELQRLHEERIEYINKEYKKMEDSRNTVALSNELARVNALIKNGYWSKSDKERLLQQQRSLESKLGIEGKNYNSSEF